MRSNQGKRTQSVQVDPSTSQQSAADFTEGRTTPEGFDRDRSLNGNAGKLSPFSAGGSDRPPSTPQARTQAIENVLAVKEKEAELNDPGLAQSVEIASPSEPPPVVEVGSKSTGEETSPITKAVESASVPQEKLNLPKEATAEKEQSTKDASEAQAQLDEKNAEAAQPPSTGINFVLPKNAIPNGSRKR